MLRRGVPLGPKSGDKREVVGWDVERGTSRSGSPAGHHQPQKTRSKVLKRPGERADGTKRVNQNLKGGEFPASSATKYAMAGTSGGEGIG